MCGFSSINRNIHISLKKTTAMKIIISTFAAISFVFVLNACNSYPMDSSNQSEMNRNAEELRKRNEAEKERNSVELNTPDNFARPK